MKLDALTVAAVAVAGLAVLAYSRNRSAANASKTAAAANDFFGLLTAQRQASGAAIPQNTAYLEFWDSPMANTLYGTGSLGD